jgi:hypothetical protein
MGWSGGWRTTRRAEVDLRSHKMLVSLYASVFSGAEADSAAAATGRGDGGTSDADHDHCS